MKAWRTPGSIASAPPKNSCAARCFNSERSSSARRTGNHLVLDADNISREHVAFERRDDQYYIVDLGSANGTYLNDERVVSAPLNQGDRVRIGSYEFQVTLREQDCILNFVPRSSDPSQD